MNGPVAIIDIGSNSIKSLVADRDAAGHLQVLHTHTVEARISAGISKSEPRLSAEGMARGVAAVEDLLARAAPFGPQHIGLVATSAVRDALNGAEFREQIRTRTGHAVRLLSGDEEANLIGRGLASDPALHGLRDFYVFDLGGGSLECLAFRGRRIEHAVSLQLGCVRLTEKFVADPKQPFSSASRASIRAHTTEVLARSAFRFSLPPGATAIGTGGTVSTVRAILGAPLDRTAEEMSPIVTVAQMEELLARLGELPLAERMQVPGLPPSRADVYPAALTTLLAIAELGGVSAFHNSFYNLRYGLVDEALG